MGGLGRWGGSAVGGRQSAVGGNAARGTRVVLLAAGIERGKLEMQAA